jgi:Ca2+-binding EF-hand superfamily protein
MTQASKDDLLISKLFREYDMNGNSYLGAYDLDLMFKKLGINADSNIIEPVLVKIDKNQSGYIEFD